MSETEVRAQYESYPYPARDPADEARRLIVGSPSDLDEVNHWLFGGRRDFARPFRALVAGGGTGDATVMLAQQLADRGKEGRVTYVDLSEASRAVAEARVRARGLSNVDFHRLSLLDLPGSGLGPFDYVDCCGVLHHLADPAAGLRALASVLAPEGGMGLMVYGELGRTGVYHMQAMMRLLAPADSSAERVATCRRLLGALPPTNWLVRNPFIADHKEGGDAGLYDLFLHSTDRAYTVAQVADLVAGAGLAVTTFIEPARYDPATYLKDPILLDRLAGLDPMERAAFAELLAGNLRKHVFYVTRPERAADAVARFSPRAVPVPRGLDAARLAAALRPGMPLKVDLDGVPANFALPPLAGAILARVDGHRSFDAILADLAAAGAAPAEDRFLAEAEDLAGVLVGLGKLALRHPD